MQPFKTLNAKAAPLRAENVDTDQIIPARFLTAVTKEGMGDGLFKDIRRNKDGSPKTEFPLNQPEYDEAEVRSVISPGFADIFFNNSLKNGLLPVTLPEETVNMLLDLVEEEPETQITINLDAQHVTLPDGQQIGFDIDNMPY